MGMTCSAPCGLSRLGDHGDMKRGQCMVSQRGIIWETMCHVPYGVSVLGDHRGDEKGNQRVDDRGDHSGDDGKDHKGDDRGDHRGANRGDDMWCPLWCLCTGEDHMLSPCHLPHNLVRLCHPPVILNEISTPKTFHLKSRAVATAQLNIKVYQLIKHTGFIATMLCFSYQMSTSL